MRKLTVIICLIWVAAWLQMVEPASGKTPQVNACGVLVQASNCVLFMPGAGLPPGKYELDNYGSFQVGDSVCVSGTLVNGCQTSCVQADACITNTNITPFGPPPPTGGPLHGCGVLVTMEGCLLFSPAGDPYSQFELNNYGNFVSGDSVCVFGFLLLGDSSACPAAEGYVLVDSILPPGPPPAPYQACGVLIQGAGCLLFVPAGSSDLQLTLQNYGPFHAADTVCITGMLDLNCPLHCPQANGCVHANTIRPYFPTGFPFQDFGTLVQDSVCVLFAPGGDPYSRFRLDNYGPFEPGDTVFVAGTLVIACPTECPAAEGCIIENTIDSAFMPGSPPIPGHAVIQLNPGALIDSVLNGTNSTVVDSILSQDTYLLSFADSFLLQSVIGQLLLRPGVEYVEPNFETGLPESQQMSISFPDEYAPPFALGTSPPAYYEQPAQIAIGCDSARQLTTGSGSVVAVVDNGLDLSHPVFANRLAEAGYDFLDNDPDPSADSGSAYSHGTFVSGLVLLVAPDCKLIPLRALNGDGVGNTFAIAQAIYYAIAHGADIINLSFGMYDDSYAVQKACSTAVAAGITLVAAAGNDGGFIPMYPAALPGVIAISGLDTMGTLAAFSNYGDHIDICAPGVRLYGALAWQFNWGTWSGTSFSAGLVSGVCALIHSLQPAFGAGLMEMHLRQTATTEFPTGTIVPPDFYYGYGRVDAAEAVWSLGSSLPGTCGDADGSGRINVSDAITIVNFVFAGGDPPDPYLAGDANCDLHVNVSDATYIINYVFAGGPQPCCSK